MGTCFFHLRLIICAYINWYVSLQFRGSVCHGRSGELRKRTSFRIHIAPLRVQVPPPRVPLSLLLFASRFVATSSALSPSLEFRRLHR